MPRTTVLLVFLFLLLFISFQNNCTFIITRDKPDEKTRHSLLEAHHCNSWSFIAVSNSCDFRASQIHDFIMFFKHNTNKHFNICSCIIRKMSWLTAAPQLGFSTVWMANRACPSSKMTNCTVHAHYFLWCHWTINATLLLNSTIYSAFLFTQHSSWHEIFLILLRYLLGLDG